MPMFYDVPLMSQKLSMHVAVFLKTLFFKMVTPFKKKCQPIQSIANTIIQIENKQDLHRDSTIYRTLNYFCI